MRSEAFDHSRENANISGVAISSTQVPSVGSGDSLLSLHDRIRVVEQMVFKTQSELASYRYHRGESLSMGAEDSKRLRAMERNLQSKDLDLLDARIEARRESLKAINARIELLELKSKLTTSSSAMSPVTSPRIIQPISESTSRSVQYGASPFPRILPSEQSEQDSEEDVLKPQINSITFSNDEIAKTYPESHERGELPCITRPEESIISMPETDRDLSASSTHEPVGFSGDSPTALAFLSVDQCDASPGIPAQPDFESPRGNEYTASNPSNSAFAKDDEVISPEQLSPANDGTPMSTTSDKEGYDSSSEKPTEQLIHGYLRFIPLEAPKLKPSPIDDEFSPVTNSKKSTVVQPNLRKRLFHNDNGGMKLSETKARVNKRVKQSDKADSPVPSIDNGKAVVRSTEKGILLRRKKADRGSSAEDGTKGGTTVKKDDSDAGKVDKAILKKERAAFKQFSKDSMDKVKREHPKLKKAGVNDLLQQMWERCTEDERKKYISKNSGTHVDSLSTDNTENIENSMPNKSSPSGTKPKEDTEMKCPYISTGLAPSFALNKRITQASALRSSPEFLLPTDRRTSNALNSTCSSVRQACIVFINFLTILQMNLTAATIMGRSKILIPKLKAAVHKA